MILEPHPDLCLQQAQVKQITRGSCQFADDKAMDAMWQALDSGMGKEEAGKVFSDTYKKCLDGKEGHASVSGS